ncbi:hypothetical protein [Mycobacterium shigaense]|uniref:Uncharacterized protein n=1 Tax=Mycobacterium shigaense TaxID=722731 RepID=A0A1Z4EKF8_9MYCO|nr:hypothetical protein [Mycobacterium shigaense]BAX93454.1 hypothetical protein MSG_03318 [Mycobacterium shigaense]
MAQAFEWTDDDGIQASCPVHGGPFGEQPLADDRVDWAGLPINLDFAFSRTHRDRVYMQHLLRKRLSPWSRGDGQRCSCGIAANYDI